ALVGAVTAVEAELYNLDEVRGALITAVQDNLPAARAGLRMGDVVLSVNDTPVQDHGDLITRLAELRPNQEVTFSIVRDGRRQNVQVTLGEFPRPDVVDEPQAPPPQEPAEQVLGFTVAELTPQYAQRAGY